MADPATIAAGSGVDWKTVALAACSIVTTSLWFYIAGMRSEMRQHALKIAEIDKKYITREELAEAIEKVDNRIETRHRENQKAWQEISNKIDINEEKESKTRHDIRDAVNTVVMQQAVLKETIEFWRKENERYRTIK